MVKFTDKATGEPLDIPGGKEALERSPNWHKDERGVWRYSGTRTTAQGKMAELVDEQLKRLEDMEYNRSLSEWEALSEEERDRQLSAKMESTGCSVLEALDDLYPRHIGEQVREQMAEEQREALYKKLSEEG